VQAQCLHDAVLSRAREKPHAVAITLGSASLTYRQLGRRARSLAQRLLSAGAAPGDFVGVLADRSLDTVVGFLGVLMAGCAYVPTDTRQPVERARAIAEDAGIRLFTGSSDTLAAVLGVPFVPAADADDGGAPLTDVSPAGAAYVIFTSGSTGRPKGVVVPHHTVVRSTAARFEVYPHDTVTYLVCAPMTIDAAVAGLYFAFAAGGRVVVPTEEESRDPELLAELVTRTGATHIDGLPAQYSALLEFHPESLRGVHCVVLGGDTLPRSVVDRHLELVPHAALYNEYGPTEGTVWCTTHRCSVDDRGPHVPIGRPIRGMRVTVLTEELEPAPPGVLGEIHLSGDGLAWGYLRRAALTAEWFIPNPDPRYPGERMYRTGDLGHVDADGTLVFRGRSDHLVKVRGFRVELGEVEARLLAHDEVVDAVVVPHESSTGVRLIAVVALGPGRSTTARTLSAFAADHLPDYMVPTVWRRVEALPVTANGKVDRRRLAASATTTGVALSG
jgi:amino acid adenylation domain-containing protein